MSIRLDTVYRHWTDRQTDRIGRTLSRSACIACWRAILLWQIYPSVRQSVIVTMDKELSYRWQTARRV